MSKRKICIVIQGPLVSTGLNAHTYLDNKYYGTPVKKVTFYSKNHCEFYDSLSYYFDDLVFSTWEDEVGFGDYEFIYNKQTMPNIKGSDGVLVDNGNLQSISSLSGVLYFLNKYGNNCTIVKIRSDIVTDAKLLFDKVRRIKDRKIYPGYIMGLCGIDDFIIAGNANELKDFFESTLHEAIINISHFDYVYNYMHFKYGKIKYLMNSMSPYIPCLAKDKKKNSGINKLIIKFENTFCPLFTKKEFNSLSLEWRGELFNKHHLAERHYSRQLFIGDHEYTKKIDCTKMFRYKIDFYKLKIKLVLKEIKKYL